MNEKRKLNVLVVGNPFRNKSSEAFLEKFIKILHPLSRCIHVISGNNPPSFDNIYWHRCNYKNTSLMQKMFGFLFSQVSIFINTILLLNKYDIIIVLPTSMAFPIILSKFFKKRTIIFTAQKIPDIPFLRILGRFSIHFSDLIIIESKNISQDLALSKYNKKIVIGNIFIDNQFFKYKINIKNREKIMGYIGGLEKRKGITELILAIKIINQKDTNIKFIIGGSGSYEKELSNIKLNNLYFKGLIPNGELTRHLNSMRLLILPSFSEGLPNIMLEAMACGTPVLATPVGAIPDVIKDSITGFIMTDNSPDCIAKNILRALEHPDLERIVENAIALVNREFTYDAAVERYKCILYQS